MAENRDSCVTWQDAEDALMAAVEYLSRLEDRDRAFLAAGARSCWPQVIRSVRDGDYGEGQGYGGEAAPSARLSRRMYAHVERMLLNPGCAAMAVPEGNRSLVGRVLTFKLWPRGEPFGWDRVWIAEGGRRTGTTSDALRKRYERGVGRVAVRMERMGLSAWAE